MASLGALPALDIQKPADPLDSATKLMGLQGMMQQQQMGKIQIQQAQKAQQDQAALGQLMIKHQGNLDKVIQDAPDAGVQPNTVIALQQHVLDVKQKTAEYVKLKGELAAHEADLQQGAHDAVAKLPEEQRPLEYQKQIAALQRQGVDTSNLPPEYPGAEAFNVLGAVARGHSVMTKEALDQQKADAETMAAQARKTAAERGPEGEMPLGSSRVAQLNQMMEQRWQVLHPGQPLFPTYKLPDNATQKDFDRADKMLEAQERAQGTQAQLAVANSIRNQTAELARQASEDRHQTSIMKPVVGTDAEGNRVLTSVEEARKQGLTGLTQADADLQNKSEAARHWLTLATKQGDTPETMGIQQLINKMDQEGKLGTVASRWNDFMAGKVGAGDPEFTALRAKMGLANTKLMQAHVGSRGGAFMLEHFEDLANAGKMNADTLKSAVGSETDYMKDVAMLPKSQRPTSAPAAKASPGTHIFSAKAWLAANPGKDVEAAKAAAKAQGFTVTE